MNRPTAVYPLHQQQSNQKTRRAFAKLLRRLPSPPELAAWEILRNRRCLGFKIRRQHLIAWYVVDFYCPELELVIEIDGATHLAQRQANRDERKDAELTRRGILILRIAPHDTCSAVLRARIAEVMWERSTHPDWQSPKLP